MMNNGRSYTTQLQAGLGLIEETRKLLYLWEENMDVATLYHTSLNSGQFPNITARRLRNIVAECFAPRYLIDNGTPALLLKKLNDLLSSNELNQFLLLYTCRANVILADFVRQVYWYRYMGGYETISKEDAKDFVIQANQEGKTYKHWSESTIHRVASYLIGCCADYGLLEKKAKSTRHIVPFRIEPRTAAILAYDIHYAGFGDNAVIGHEDWGIFGLQTNDVRDELKQLSLKGFFIVQAAGDIIQIDWKFKTMEELINAIVQR